MKEATGELNVTVIVVLAVAMLGAFFYGVIWPMIHNGIEQDTSCDAAWCAPLDPDDDSGIVKCCIGKGTVNGYDVSCSESEVLYCPYKG